MVRATRYLFFVSFSVVTSFVYSQSKEVRIERFSDLISYLETHTQFKFSYSGRLVNIALTVRENVNLSDPMQLEKLLAQYGIEVVRRGDLLIFRKRSNTTKNVSGFVRDAESGESLVGANVVDVTSGKGVATNTFGFFSLDTSGDSIAVSFVGYAYQKLAVSQAEDGFVITLSRENNILTEVLISGADARELAEMSTVRLSPDQVKKLPVFMGETDMLKTLQLLPGVQAGTEGTAGFHVRGGGPDQNLILLDGVPVYNANHLFGFFSVFNADAINSVELIKGGFPARYGGRLSSIVDIQMKEGNLHELEGEGAIGLVASKITVSGPINKGKTSFMLSARRTYIDAFAVPLAKLSGSDRVVGGSFWDVNAKVNHIMSPKDRVYASFYSGRDKLYDEYSYDNEGVKEDEHAEIQWGNITSALRWNHQYTDRLFSNLTATYTRYQFELGTRVNYQYADDLNTPDIYRDNEYYSNIRDVGLKMDFDYFLNNDHLIKFGANLVHHALRPGVSNFRSHIQADTTFGSTKIGLDEMYVYAEDEVSLSNATRANIGVHYSAARAGSKTYTSWQPRVTLSQRLGSALSVKASYSRMAQYIHLLVNSGIGLPTDLWVPSTERVKPQLSDQVALGLSSGYRYIEISVEGYYKWMNNLIEYKDGAGFLDIDSRWENKVEFGSGKSYGAEFFVQKKSGRFTGWLSYTWSKSIREFDNLNFGKPFPYRYDRRHNVSVVYNVAVNSRIDIGAVWVYSTGNAVTLPTSTYPKAIWDSNQAGYEDYIKHYPGRNSSRMKDYHRLDLSISFKKATRWGERKWVVGLYNSYNRLNPIYIELNDENRLNKKFRQLSIFPLIPNVSYQFKF
ncbi:TonB-dependent receptor [Parachryseolinea silvisoli]|uniref:TonB-dependent receptor n=1 Tax=Parachryseolinea silvisoli TaxID=2873601 RepID=UPI002265C45D|nr:TonB-dependent receptor [Parachryseolinea silvisoli]MCD9015325.1 TonB-dependent receptor [Parachryseolinea silvisoli]